MHLIRFAQELSAALTIALVLRLLVLRLHRVYRIFCIFLLYDLFCSCVFLYEAFAARPLDYRITWMVLRPGAWVLSLWMVYALLSTLLETLPGILRFSRTLLTYAFPIAIVLAALTFKPQYSAAVESGGHTSIERAVAVGLVLDRVIATIALIVLLAMLLFVLWFPVKMPRNLALFSIGYVIYFAAETGLVLMGTMSHFSLVNVASTFMSFTVVGCLLYWTIFIRKSGEKVPIRIGHKWRPDEQHRLIEKLEAMNAALLHVTSTPSGIR